MMEKFNLKNDVGEVVKYIRSFVSNTAHAEKMVNRVNILIGLLRNRGYGDRERLFRKLVEELGEYAEAVEFDNGATRKVEKFKDKDPKEMLKEEVSDIVMVALALARSEGMLIEDVLEIINEKLSTREKEFNSTKK